MRGRSEAKSTFQSVFQGGKRLLLQVGIQLIFQVIIATLVYFSLSEDETMRNAAYWIGSGLISVIVMMVIGIILLNRLDELLWKSYRRKGIPSNIGIFTKMTFQKRLRSYAEVVEWGPKLQSDTFGEFLRCCREKKKALQLANRISMYQSVSMEDRALLSRFLLQGYVHEQMVVDLCKRSDSL